MIKILHYIPAFSYGGIESLFLNWYKNIDKSKFQIDLLLRTQDENEPALREYKKLYGIYYRISPLTNLRKYKEDLNEFFKNHHDYDIVHVHNVDPLILKYIHKYKLKIIVHAHTSKEYPSIRAWYGYLNTRITQSLYADYAIACSTPAAKFAFGGNKFKGNDVTILYNTIECDKFSYNNKIRQKIRKQFNLKDKFVIGHVGRTAYAKNQFFLLDIFKEVLKINKESVLLFIGEGNDINALYEYANKLNILENILFVGQKNNTNEFYQAMDCFLLPSRWEGMPITLIEAQCSALPCFISSTISDEVDISKSLIFRKSINESAKSWAEEIVKVDVASRIINSKKKIDVSSFSISNGIQMLENFYTQIVKQ